MNQITPLSCQLFAKDKYFKWNGFMWPTSPGAVGLQNVNKSNSLHSHFLLHHTHLVGVCVKLDFQVQVREINNCTLVQLPFYGSSELFCLACFQGSRTERMENTTYINFLKWNRKDTQFIIELLFTSGWIYGYPGSTKETDINLS